ncbi:MAG: hypothetical protein EBX52_00390, partial [Proteobacteria bacterium]|nr:hypothetical protein [Pseudomonadota bacterium]
KYTPHAAPSHPVALHPDARDEKKHSEKELEELRDLKKELQELKALKEQLRETPLTDESMEEEAPPFNPDAAASPGPGAPDSQAGSTN